MTDTNNGTALVGNQPAPNAPGARWSPVEGEEARSLVQHVFNRGGTQSASGVTAPGRAVLTASSEILGRGVDPAAALASETGLVAGYVQSGKTLSFTTVSALARDNGFHVVIVMTGTSINLFEQSTRRIRADFRLDEPRDRKWIMLNNPRVDQRATLQNLVRDWRDPFTPEELKRTALITVMKHHDHLHHLTALLSQIDLSGSPVLVIDDEADQASMNTRVNQQEESTTYQRICELRGVLPIHTFLQYTATPQAPLLINIIDSLSPNFVKVLEPGDGYVGGGEIFGNSLDNVVVEIPDDELTTDPDDQEDPPQSLIDALRTYVLGVAVAYHNRSTSGNRSMLIHPSHRRDAHSVYTGWVSRLIEQWTRVLQSPDTDPASEVFDDFEQAHDGLAQTVSDIVPFAELVESRSIQIALRACRVVEVNTRRGRTPPIPWTDNYCWILVAGQAVDRGFTVEGLTVTYMPRGIGVGNADTLQQRGRFFGYKRSYLGFCRVYLPADIIDAFVLYVQHEEDVRDRLREYERTGRPLNEWKRAFILDSTFRPTRSAVLDLDYMRGRFSNDWATPIYPVSPPGVLEENRWTVQNFLAELDLVPDLGHASRTPNQLHLMADDIALSTVLEDLLVPYRTPASSDNQKFIGLMLQLKRALDENPNEVCSVYQMSPSEHRVRGTDQFGRITNLFQGAYPVNNPGRGSIYPGDLRLRSNDRVTVQCHSLRVTDPDGGVLAENVPILAVWVPSRMGAGWLVQDEA